MKGWMEVHGRVMCKEGRADLRPDYAVVLHGCTTCHDAYLDHGGVETDEWTKENG